MKDIMGISPIYFKKNKIKEIDWANLAQSELEREVASFPLVSFLKLFP